MNMQKVLPEFLVKRLDRGRLCVDEFVELTSHETADNALILDAGAGECHYKKFFHHARYYAVDLTVGDIKWDYSRIDVASDLLKLPFRNNTFDVILCTQVLEHIKMPMEFVKELFRILKAGGKLYLTAPQGFEEHQVPYDFFRYTSFGLMFLFEQAGFQIDYIKPKGGFFYYLADRIQSVHSYLFSKRRAIYYKILFLPLEPVSKIIFSVLLPLIIGSLDSFDRERKLTNGYMCKVSKISQEACSEKE